MGTLTASQTPGELYATSAPVPYTVLTAVCSSVSSAIVQRYLDKILEATYDLRQLVPTYSANIIFTGLLEYCNEDVFYADEYVVASHDLRDEAKNYSEFVRMIDGIPGPFIVSIWPKSLFPDVKEYVQALPYVIILPGWLSTC